MEIGNHMDSELFTRFIAGLQKLFGDKCEILVHDYRKGYDSAVVHIVNGELSGRKLGDPPRGGMFYKLNEDITPYQDSRVFFFKGFGGKYFKSCTTLIKDGDNKIIGSICVNIEVSDFMAMGNMIQSFMSGGSEEGAENGDISDDLFKNIDEILQGYVKQSEAMIGTPLPLMSKAEKIRAIDFLDQKGVFKISKANVLLCEAFQISKYTLYNHLEEARSMREALPETVESK